jgi:rfaE bifunctional protein kinase chain/domain/rfaE bifunctional protein nucleotidyltransferase chain/domain
MKILALEQLAKIIRDLKSSGKRIVHCHGVFDLLHIGHIRYFEQARRMGDILVVTVTSDNYVDKGPHRPAFTEVLRAEAVSSLSSVDFVAINKWPTAEETLRLLRPDVYVKGSEFKKSDSDMTGKIDREKEVVREIGGEIAFTEDIVFSSTNLINRYLSNLPDEIEEYLGLFRQRHHLADILQILEKMASLNVLVIGDTILDEYQYCEAIGKSSKDPVLTVKYQSKDLFAGGILAVANHVANFAGKVDLVTTLGEQDSYEEFIRSQLLPNITPYFTSQPGAPTLIKRRYVDGYSFNKLFEMYVIDDSGLPPDKNRKICEWLHKELPNYDVVIVADYGHGAISEEVVQAVCDGARFLAVNTQANSANRGFHTITRYPRADHVCIAEHEIRLETRKRNGGIRPLMEPIAKKLGASKFVVTRGRKGSLVLGDQKDFVAVPTFAQNVVDRVGAGDSFLSVTALAAALGVSNELLGFIGNVAGSLAVEILGNKKSIDKLSLQKYIVSLMK